MALTGLQIYKLLPKTNCGDCGSPTCLAFAMRLAGKKSELTDCPHVSDEAKETLGSASAPPIRLVTIGTENKLEIGNETVLFRHDQTFYHPTGIAVEIEDSLSEEEIKKKVEAINSLVFERVGQVLKVELIAVKETGKGDFISTVKLVSQNTDKPLILMTFNPSLMEEALKINSFRPLIYAATLENYQEMAALSLKYNCSLAALGNLDQLAELTPKLNSAGVRDIVLDAGGKTINSTLNNLTHIRRMALRKSFRPFGYPAMAFTDGDSYQEVMQAGTYLAKYAGIVVVKGTEAWKHLALLTLRQNIYTDPQKPIQVEPKIYEIGNPSTNSPVYVTTNFSLTYYTVASEIEASRIPSYLLVIDTEGTSVLTAWASEKFTAEKIADALKNYGITDKVQHRKVIIPGYVAVLSGKLEEASSWKVIVGPKEAVSIPAFIKNLWKEEAKV